MTFLARCTNLAEQERVYPRVLHVHGLAALGTLGGPGPRGPRYPLSAGDYRDVTLSLWPPWSGPPREPHSPTPRCTSPCPCAPLAPCSFFLILPPIHGPLCLLEPTGRRAALPIAGPGNRSAFDSASSLSLPANELAASSCSPVRKPDAALRCWGHRITKLNKGLKRKEGLKSLKTPCYGLPTLWTPIWQRVPGE